MLTARLASAVVGELKSRFGARPRGEEPIAPPAPSALPLIAQVDNFTGTTHGAEVREVLEHESGWAGVAASFDVSRPDASGPTYRTWEEAQAWIDTLTTRSIRDQVEALDDCRGAIEGALAQHGNTLQVFNLSLAQGGAYALQAFSRQILNPVILPAQRQENIARLSQALQLPEDASEKDVVAALIRRMGEAEDQDPSFQASKARYDETCREVWDRGMVTVVGAGNLGDFGGYLLNLGVESQRVLRNVLINDNTVVVGAVAPDGQPAEYASPVSGAQLGADGLSVMTRSPGCSFSAPRVAEVIAEIPERYPGVNAHQALEIVLDTSREVEDPMGRIGGRILDREAALRAGAALSKTLSH